VSDERMDEWECRSTGTHGEGPYSIERGPSEDGPLQKAATGISSYPLACAIEGIANGLDEFMDICPSVGTAPQRPKADPPYQMGRVDCESHAPVPQTEGEDK